MNCGNRNVSDKEELLSSPPPYEFSTQSQQAPPNIIVNNTTVVQHVALPAVSLPVEVIDSDCFRKDTPRSARRGFLRNLFLVIAAQFLLIDGIIAMIIFLPLFHDKMMDKKNSTGFYITWMVSVTILAIISFWERARRIPPANYVTIIIFTIFQGITLGCAACFDKVSLILLASVGTTAIVCLATALFELQGRYYLGNFRSVLYVWGLNAVGFGISLTILHITAAGIAAGLSTLFCTYLVVNAQMMTHGTTRYVLTSKEYVFGAMNIYVDIVHGILICLGAIGICGCGIASCCRVCTN